MIPSIPISVKPWGKKSHLVFFELSEYNTNS
jgi:hypothetical protein